MFYGPTPEEVASKDPKWDALIRLYASHLSDYYKANNSDRLPLFVILPGMVPFCIDGQCQSNGEFYGGWTVIGEPPLINVMPSINLGGTYHGFLQHGVISPDCEGRQYDEHGYQIRKED